MSTQRHFWMIIITAALVLMDVSMVNAQSRNPSGLPVPRYMSIRPDEANLRTGPGVRYPIDWVIRAPNLPVEVVAEYDTWRKIRDYQNTEGWVHRAMLSPRRTVMIVGDLQTLRARPQVDAAPIARAEGGVIGRLLNCAGDWCRLEVAIYRGWLRRSQIWGVYDDEVLE